MGVRSGKEWRSGPCEKAADGAREEGRHMLRWFHMYLHELHFFDGRVQLPCSIPDSAGQPSAICSTLPRALLGAAVQAQRAPHFCNFPSSPSAMVDCVASSPFIA